MPLPFAPRVVKHRRRKPFPPERRRLTFCVSQSLAGGIKIRCPTRSRPASNSGFAAMSSGTVRVCPNCLTALTILETVSP
jgi:hypothetical protein